jgi:hypothetical protein
VYALLALASGADDALIKPDYELPVHEVYIRTTKHLILKKGHLDILAMCAPPNKLTGLPSWVPDWSHEPDESSPHGTLRGSVPPRKEGTVGIYSTDGGMSAEVSFNDSTGTMLAKGCAFDTIRELGDILTHDSFNPSTFQSPIIFSWKRMAEAPSDLYPTGESRKKAFLHTLVADSQFEVTPKTAKNKVRGARELDNDLRISKDAETRILRNRRFVITTMGYFGLVPKDAGRGDTICVLWGGQMPFVLRQENGYYVLVGECYVHGKMDGEVMKDVKAGKLREEIFDIR